MRRLAKATQLEILIATECFDIKFNNVVCFSAHWETAQHMVFGTEILGAKILPNVSRTVIPWHICQILGGDLSRGLAIETASKALLMDLLERWFGKEEGDKAYIPVAHWLVSRYPRIAFPDINSSHIAVKFEDLSRPTLQFDSDFQEMMAGISNGETSRVPPIRNTFLDGRQEACIYVGCTANNFASQEKLNIHQITCKYREDGTRDPAKARIADQTNGRTNGEDTRLSCRNSGCWAKYGTEEAMIQHSRVCTFEGNGKKKPRRGQVTGLDCEYQGCYVKNCASEETLYAHHQKCKHKVNGRWLKPHLVGGGGTDRTIDTMVEPKDFPTTGTGTTWIRKPTTSTPMEAREAPIFEPWESLEE
jgi:hypothetical protein